MKTSMRVEKPDDINFTLTITMPLAHWIALRNDLKAGWPTTDLSLAINNLVYKAREVFRPDPTPDQPPFGMVMPENE